MAVSPTKAAGIILPIVCVMDVFAIRKFWGKWDLDNLTIMLPVALAGVLLGALTYSYFNDTQVRLIIGFGALAFALNFWFKSNRSVKQKT